MSSSTDVTRTPIGVGEVVAIGAGSLQSAVFPVNTKTVRLVATADCFVEIGGNPTAAANTSTYLPAGSVEYFSARDGWKVAVIQASGSGSLYVRETN